MVLYEASYIEPIWGGFYKHLCTKEWYIKFQDIYALELFKTDIGFPSKILEILPLGTITSIGKLQDANIPLGDYIGERGDEGLNVYYMQKHLERFMIENTVSNTPLPSLDLTNVSEIYSSISKEFGFEGIDLIKLYWYFKSLYDRYDNLYMEKETYDEYQRLLKKEAEKYADMNIENIKNIQRFLRAFYSTPHLNTEMFYQALCSILLGCLVLNPQEEWTWHSYFWKRVYLQSINETIIYSVDKKRIINMIAESIKRNEIQLLNISNYGGGKRGYGELFMNWQKNPFT